ncbi:MAG: GGDEF domain-containing protein [Lachnospiraceae bacterium]|nr:GGDEF domain-containing protein [Lachnospiraceae bacterium]
MNLKLDDIYISIINNMQDGAYFVDRDRKILFWNKAAERITGYTADEIIGRDCPSSGLNHIDDEGRPLCQVGCPLFATNVDGKTRRERVFVRHKDGYRVPLQVNIFPIVKEGVILGSIELFTQDSPTRYDDNLIEHLSGIAMHDALTKLPNRRYLESFLNYKLTQMERFSKNFCVMFADIDNFSEFNNKYGHDVGDLVLGNIANTLKRNVRKDDLVGRWGGEEFVGIYTVSNSYEAPIIAEKFRKMVEATEVHHGEEALKVSVSIGVTVGHMGDTASSIIERADRLMYASKQEGKNRVTSD